MKKDFEHGSDRNLGLLNEGPDTIGMMTAVIENGGSLDSAIRAVATEGPEQVRKLFSRIVWDADTRVESDMSLALSRCISDLPDGCASFGMALRMVMSASIAKEDSERSRILKEASEISLNGLREAGKTFTSSLNTPCMMIFGVGIMIPLVLMSILPMMGMGNSSHGQTSAQLPIAFITLVLIPASVLCLISGISRRNPLADKVPFGNISPILPLLSAIPFYFVLGNLTDDGVVRFCASMALSGILAYAFTRKNGRDQRKNKNLRKFLEDSIFEIGNRLLTGTSFENAVYETLASHRKEEKLGERFRDELLICRGDMGMTLTNVFSPVSEEITDILRNIHSAASRNPLDGGRLALSLGRQMKDREGLRKGLKNELKSMTDTMFGTAAVFAPLVLGLSVSMLEPMRVLTSEMEIGNTPMILSLYLCELSAIISLLLSFIDGRCDCKNIVSRFASVMPVAMTVFIITMNVSFF